MLLILVLQSSCAFNLQSLIKREAGLQGRTDFNGYLAREYLQYSRDLANRYDWRDSDYFAQKGIMASDNQETFPEVPEAWDLDASKIEEAVIARQRLQLLLNPKVKRHLPIQLAHLTMLFDCWLSKEQKPWALGALARCKTRFLRLADEAEEYMANLKPKKKVKIVEVKEPDFEKFDVYFDFNSYRFNSRARRELVDILDFLESVNGDFRILLLGNTDRKGKKLYNDNLARRRVLMVKNMLMKNGVPKDVISADSFGEKVPKIITKNNKRNKYNRMVGVYVLRGEDSFSLIPLPLIDNYIYRKEIKNMKKNKGLRS